MRLAEHLTALRAGASNVCLVGISPTCLSRHCGDAMVYIYPRVKRLRPCMNIKYTPPPPPPLPSTLPLPPPLPLQPHLSLTLLLRALGHQYLLRPQHSRPRALLQRLRHQTIRPLPIPRSPFQPNSLQPQSLALGVAQSRHLEHRPGLVHAEGFLVKAGCEAPEGDRPRANRKSSLVVAPRALRQTKLFRAKLFVECGGGMVRERGCEGEGGGTGWGCGGVEVEWGTGAGKRGELKREIARTCTCLLGVNPLPLAHGGKAATYPATTLMNTTLLPL